MLPSLADMDETSDFAAQLAAALRQSFPLASDPPGMAKGAVIEDWLHASTLLKVLDHKLAWMRHPQVLIIDAGVSAAYRRLLSSVDHLLNSFTQHLGAALPEVSTTPPPPDDPIEMVAFPDGPFQTIEESDVVRLERGAQELRGFLPSKSFDDPITWEQAAKLMGWTAKYLSNIGVGGRPAARQPARGGRPAVYSYAELRPWLLAKYPNTPMTPPKSYEKAKEIFALST